MRKGGGRPQCQTVASEIDTCPVAGHEVGGAGKLGGARPGLTAGSRHSCPAPVGVGGAGGHALRT